MRHKYVTVVSLDEDHVEMFLTVFFNLMLLYL